MDGRLTDRIALVGQAPGAVELTTGLPFSGRSGAILRRWLAEAGIADDAIPYRTAVTKCFPGKATSGPGDRRPSPPEITLCAPWLEAELKLLRPEVLMLVGQLAIERFWGKAALADVVGQIRRPADGPVLIPFPHPSGASRWLNQPANQALLRRAIAHLRREARRLAGGRPPVPVGRRA